MKGAYFVPLSASKQLFQQWWSGSSCVVKEVEDQIPDLLRHVATQFSPTKIRRPCTKLATNYIVPSHFLALFYSSPDNLVDVASLFLLKDAFLKLLACNAHQISLHSSGGMPPRPVHASKTKVRLLGRRWASNDDINKKMIEEVMGGGSATSEMEMDMRYVYLPRTDKTTHYLELFHHSENDGGGGLEPWTRSMSHDSANVRAVCDGAAGEQRSVVFPNNNEMNHDAANSSPVERNVSESPPKLEEPPSLHEVKNGQEFVGIDDILGNEDMDQLLTLLLD